MHRFRFFVALVGLGLLSHCSLEFPHTRIFVGLETGFLQNAYTSQMQCFFVNITGTGISSATLSNLSSGCTSMTLGTTSTLVSESAFTTGVTVSGIPLVGTSTRTVEVYGVITTAASCSFDTSKSAVELLFSSSKDVPDVYLVGRSEGITFTSGIETVITFKTRDIKSEASLNWPSCKTFPRLTVADHACMRLSGNSIKCWGNNGVGRLGLGDTSNRGDGANEMGNNLPTVNLGTGRSANFVALGGEEIGDKGMSCALLDNKTIKCWGINDSGQLGLGDTSNRGDGANEMGDNLPTLDLGTGRTVKQVSITYVHGCAILDNNALKCWGRNEAGGLGLGDTLTRGDEPNEMGENLSTVNLGTGRIAKDVSVGVGVAATSGFSCALLDNNTVKCWGRNDLGQLGLGDTNNRGDGANEMADNLPAIDLGTGRTAKQITVGSAFACALLDNSTVKCWGDTASGQLGLGDNTNNRGDVANEMGDNLPAIDLGTGRTAKKIMAGYKSACAELDNDTVKCWGNNSAGELGQGDANSRGDGANEMGDNLPAIDLGS